MRSTRTSMNLTIANLKRGIQELSNTIVMRVDHVPVHWELRTRHMGNWHNAARVRVAVQSNAVCLKLGNPRVKMTLDSYETHKTLVSPNISVQP